MISSSSRSLSAFTVPAWLQGRSTATQVLAVLFGTLVLAASSQVSVPMVPVPMTMQTLAVTLVGALYGWRLGGLTILVWLAQGALGLPVFAGGSGGFVRFFGPTAGYLLAFPIAGALTGWLVERGWNGSKLLLACAAMLIGNAPESLLPPNRGYNSTTTLMPSCKPTPTSMKNTNSILSRRSKARLIVCSMTGTGTHLF